MTLQSIGSKELTFNELSDATKAIYNAIINASGLDADRILMLIDRDDKTSAEYIGICYK